LANATPPPAASDEDATDLSEVGATPSPPPSVGVVAIVLAAGLLITGIVTWTSWSLDNHNESRLLKLQTDQAAEVLTAAVPDTEAPLATAVEIASATQGNVHAVASYLSPFIGPDRTFTSASLWRLNGASPRRVAMLGSTPSFSSAAATRSWVARAFRSSGFVAGALFFGKRGRLVLALTVPGTKGRYGIYAEHTIPADRQASVASSSAFSDLNYAIYLGKSTNPSDLLTTSFRRPPTGLTAKVSVPFGNSALTLVTSPRGQLGGTLPARLPWIFGVLGVLLSLVAAWTAERLVRRRRSAERDAIEIRRLYGELGTRFGEQRTIAETLQRALLPRETPDIAGMEVAVQYVPGAKGMEIGGDWYSIIPTEEGRFAFVVGDVSGRGLSAATVMAALRFTIRTYAVEGYPPEAILEKCSKQLRVPVDGHFATVLVGIGDVDRHEITLANAGHFNPLVIDGNKTTFVDTVLGVPLGVAGGAYKSVTVSVPPRSTLIAFTDGLIEHRGESLDVGLQRLEEAARGDDCPLDLLLSKVITDLTDETSEDDIAMLALRWKS
jgi:serine phosphatase RsbU (regulator of sigma subunit)